MTQPDRPAATFSSAQMWGNGDIGRVTTSIDVRVKAAHSPFPTLEASDKLIRVAPERAQILGKG